MAFSIKKPPDTFEKLNILSREYPFDKSAYSDSDLNKIGETYGGTTMILASGL